MSRVLFVKKSGRISGGHIKLHDYFSHCLAHPALDPDVYLAFAEERGVGSVWENDRMRIVPALDTTGYDLVFIDGRDWDLLPDAALPPVVHLIQDFRHGDSGDPRHEFLSRSAFRICISPELAEAVRPHANGPVAVIPNGIDAGMFRAQAKRPRSVVVWARKNAKLGKQISGALSNDRTNVRLLTKPIARGDWAALLSGTEVFVGLTKEREGFFLPALEAMASGCAVVCADAIGNRGYCRDGMTCRIARFADASDHARLACELLTDERQRERLVSGATAITGEYTIERERAAFFSFVGDQVLDGKG